MHVSRVIGSKENVDTTSYQPSVFGHRSLIKNIRQAAAINIPKNSLNVYQCCSYLYCGYRCLNWKIYWDDLQPQYKYELFHIYATSFHCTGRYELNTMTSLPMCGFIAQLVEHRTSIAEVTGSNPVEALIFFRLSSNCLNWKIYCDDHSSLLCKLKLPIWCAWRSACQQSAVFNFKYFCPGTPCSIR